MIDLPPADPGIEVSIASRGMSKGIAQTEGPQLLVKPSVKLGDVQIGAQWKNVTSPVADGEGAVFVGWGSEVAGFQLSLQAAHKFQTRVREPADDRSWEFTGNVARKLGRVTLRGSVIYSPDDLGGAKRSVYLEAGPSLDLDKHTKLSASVGRRNRMDGDDYTSFNAGISRVVLKGFTIEARYYGTNRSELGENYEERLIALARMTL